MFRKIFSLLVLSIICLSLSTTVFADDLRPNNICNQKGGDRCCNSDSGPCVVDGSFECLPAPEDPGRYSDNSVYLKCKPSTVSNVFGKIQPPPALAGFLKNDPTGASAISDFLSRFVSLLFSVAAIVLIFMILWGAFEWLTSGGDKEKLSSAQKRIINAIIGIILFAVAFAIIRVLGQFTGFSFFKEQAPIPAGCIRDKDGTIVCPYGT